MKMGNLALRAGVVVACALFVSSMGAGVKFRSFAACGSCAGENPNVDGMCMVKYDPHAFSPELGATGISTVHLHVEGLRPNTLYGFKVDSDGSGFSDPQAFTTDNKGNGDYHRDIPQDATLNTTCVIYVWDGFQGFPIDSGDDIYTVTNDEIRAAGSV